MVKTAGFLLNRKPIYEKLYFDGPLLEPINGVFYQGLHRSPWLDIQTHYHEKTLPEHLLIAFNLLDKSDNDGTFTKITKNIHDIYSFLNVTNELKLKNEIVVISSNVIDRIKGTILLHEEQIQWLGYDCVLLGGWSLIKHGIFENKQLSLLNNSKLNKHGLFDTFANVNEFVATYNYLSMNDKVDPIIEDLTLEMVRIGKLL